MASRICGKVLLTLVICFISRFERISAYHIPRSDELAAEEYNPEYREPSEEYSVDKKQNLREARSDYPPLGIVAPHGGCLPKNNLYEPSACHSVPLTEAQTFCLTTRPECVVVELFKTEGCRETHHYSKDSSNWFSSDQVRSFRYNYDRCSKGLQDTTGLVSQSQKTNSQDTSLEIPDDNGVNSETPSRWFQAKLQEFKRKGRLLTKL